MSEKIIGLLVDISQLVLGVVVEETDERVVLNKAALLGISGKNNNINLNFIPIEMLSIDPPIGLRNLAKNPGADIHFPFEKKDLYLYDVDLNDQVLDNYRKVFGLSPALQVPPSVPVPTTPSDVVKLF